MNRQHEATEEKCYSIFRKSIRAQATLIAYHRGIRNFKDYTKVATYQELLKYDVKPLQDKIIDYVEVLKEKAAATNTIRTRLSGIQHFFMMNDVILNWGKIYRFVGESRKIVQDRIYTKEEIQRILDKCDERKKVMFFLLLAGLRIGALPSLNIRDLKKWDQECVYQVTVYAGDKEQYTTFVTPEGTKAIDSYLEYRRMYGEVLKPGAPLLREQFNPTASASDPARLSLSGMQNTMNRILIDAGLRVRGHDPAARKEVMRFHGFRKYFNTMLNKAGVKPIIKEVLMGHKVGLEASYLRASDEELLGEYLKAVDSLTISEEKELRVKVDKLQVQNDQLVDILRNKIAALERANEVRETGNERVHKIAPVVLEKNKSKV